MVGDVKEGISTDYRPAKDREAIVSRFIQVVKDFGGAEAIVEPYGNSTQTLRHIEKNILEQLRQLITEEGIEFFEERSKQELQDFAQVSNTPRHTFMYKMLRDLSPVTSILRRGDQADTLQMLARRLFYMVASKESPFCKGT
jgi:hypothetical protein